MGLPPQTPPGDFIPGPLLRFAAFYYSYAKRSCPMDSSF